VLSDLVPGDYASAYDEAIRLKKLEPELANRKELLKKLSRSAPNWASAIQSRNGRHGMAESPGDPALAWEWRQLHDELEERASVSLEELQQSIEDISKQLLDVTAQLIDKKTWVNQIRQTTHEQQQALGAFVTLRNKLTKTGKGVLDDERLSAARRELAVAKDAVPVWIMPLADVAEAFDPRNTRFDVVIIDEASQCDPSSLFALYLGRQTVIVGDDEQVTPVAIGIDTEEMIKLIHAHLDGVPHNLLYDGETSIYDLAQMAFGGGVIRLTEHFRCAPNIIAFSNGLSYGDIKPLRESSAIPLKTHVVPYRVADGASRKDNVNENEAETVAALICAAIEDPEYAKNELGAPATFGVVSLVGDKQALKIDAILRQRLEPAEYQRRQILCGDSAQFQGDERDVMFLSVVDSPSDRTPLPMRQEGPKRIFKKRFNVAASRARNQMWVVYSLNHEVDLQAGDYRRRIIEHALDPEAWERELRKRARQTESIFEERVLKRLLQANYHVVPQFQVGAYRIDMVVIGNGPRLAIECDGERFHGPEKLQEDMGRQAILERLGWKFVRIRGSLFFRDEERAMEPVFRRLDDLTIAPSSVGTIAAASIEDPVIEVVKRRAQELRQFWNQAATEGLPELLMT
jgi:very-short-patch-repair endonuclease